MRHLEVQKNVSYKNRINSINIFNSRLYRKFHYIMVNGWKILKYILICLPWMKLTWIIQLCKNVFAINNSIIVLNIHEQDLTKVCNRGLHGLEPDAKSVLGPVCNFSNGPGRKMKGDFSNRPGRQLRGDFSNGPGRPGPEKSARADL